MIPGIQDFYDGMHHHLINEMQQAVDDVHKSAVAPDQDHHHDKAMLADDVNPSHDVIGHSAAHDSLSAHHHEPDQHSFFNTVVPSVLHGVVKGALTIASELATESVLSDVLLSSAAPTHHDHVAALHVGHPGGDGFTHQTTGFTCAVVSQKMILDQFHVVDPHTGEPVSEAQLVYDATIYGWLTDHGTSLNNLNKLLDHYGVASHAGHDWKHLIHDLAEGHQVQIVVNADELWSDHGPFSELAHLFGNSPNHALVLKGLKVDDHGKVVVVVNDPGQADGAGVEYSLEHFQSAIDSIHMHYIATDHAPPGWSPDLAIRQLACQTSIASHESPLTHSDVPSFVDTMTRVTDSDRESFLRSI